MHITGPTLVTIPLHISTSLAFGVLQRGGGDKIIHYGRDTDEKDKIPDKEKTEEVTKKDEEGEENDKEILMERTEDNMGCGGMEIEKEGTKENQEKQEDCGCKPEAVMADVSRELQPKILSPDFEEANNDEDSEYMSNYISLLPIFYHQTHLLPSIHSSTHPLGP